MVLADLGVPVYQVQHLNAFLRGSRTVGQHGHRYLMTKAIESDGREFRETDVSQRQHSRTSHQKLMKT